MKKHILILFSVLLFGCSTNQNNSTINEKTTKVSQKEESSNIGEIQSIEDIYHDNINQETKSSISKITDNEFVLELLDGSYLDDNYPKPTFLFSKDKTLGVIIKGFSGCNNYLAQYSVTRSILITKNFASTNKICNDEAMVIESVLFNHLNRRPFLLIKNNEIYFKTQDREIKFIKK